MKQTKAQQGFFQGTLSFLLRYKPVTALNTHHNNVYPRGHL
ncbi:MAG: hypothetical protein ACRD23_11605 [Terriglobales bacterium]